MSAKGEKIVGKSPVFIGQTGGASDASLQTFLESEFLIFKLDLTFLDWTSTLFFSLLLGVHEILSFFVLPEGFDPLALVEGFTPVEDNRGLLVTLGMLPDDVSM
ncbi:hypothetical protein Tco_1406056 [Tanacetum coccineum]